MTTIVTRAGKGSPLTNTELDANFTNLKTTADAALPLSGGTLTGNLSLGDNVKAQFGAGNDLEIYHDASASYIEEKGTGSLYIKGTQLRMQATDGTTYLEANDGGAVTLKHSGATVFNTTSTGINVTGSVTSTGLTVNSGTTNTVATFTSTDSGAGVTLTDNTGSSNFQTTDANLRIGVDDDNAVANSAIQFRVDGSTKATINSSGNVNIPNGKLGIGFTSAPSNTLEVKSSGNDNGILLKGSGGNSIAWIHQQSTDAATLRLYDGSNLNVLIGSNANSDSYFNTGGRVGIGTTAPTHTLHVDGTVKVTGTQTFDAVSYTHLTQPTLLHV